jgi:hypothetical protein
MAGTNRYMNFGGFSFNSVAVTGITDFTYDSGLSTKSASGDADPGPTITVVDFANPTFSFTTLDAFALQALIGTRGVFTGTVRDAYNGVSPNGGAKMFITNGSSILDAGAASFRHREYGTRSYQVATMWLDPATPPVSLSAL